MVVAGTHSGAGKTTVAVGLMAALAARGSRVGAAKVGPDFIDPGYHAIATGRPPRNLDEWMCGTDAVAPLAARAGAGTDVLVVEGVMGLFDGAVLDGPESSTASVARRITAPVLLVVDASAMGASVAALVDGYTRHDPRISIAGVVLNKVGSDGHEEILRDALANAGVEVFGALRRDDTYCWRDRHLGLVPVVEDRASVRASLDALAGAVLRGIDLDAVLRAAKGAPQIRCGDTARALPSGRARIAVAGGAAFSFAYHDNLEQLEHAGGELAAFDPARDTSLPPGTDALYACGGFPEVYAGELSSNASLREEVRRRVTAGMPVWAECGGMAWLSATLDGKPMCGVLPCDVEMTGTLTLGYRYARVHSDNPVAPAGSVLRGHEFHYSHALPCGDALELTGRRGSETGGFASTRVLASYLHLHMGADTSPAERFVACASAGASRRR